MAIQEKEVAVVGLEPLGPRVLIRPDDPISHVGMIQLPDKAQRKVTRGTILAVGDWDEDWGRELHPGDRVIYSEYAGIEVKHEGENLLIMALKDIHAREAAV